MVSLRSLFLLTLTCASAVVAQEQPQPAEQHLESQRQFSELLEALPEESVRSALGMHPQFRDGVWENNKNAVVAVHKDNPSLATRLLAVAALDLLKRQNGTAPPTSTAPPPPPPTTQLPPPTTSNNPPPPPPASTSVIVTVVVSTTNAAGSTVAVTKSVAAPATVSVAVSVTTTNAKGQTVVSATTVAGAVVVSDGKTITAPAPVFTNGAEELTTTDAAGSTFVTTFTPSGGAAISSLLLITTTLPDGSQTVMTTFAAVPTGSDGGSSGPHLQNAAALRRAPIALPLAAIGAALLI